MSVEVTKIIKAFSKFLDPKFTKKLEISKEGKTIKIESLDDIKELPLYAYNFIDLNEAKYLDEFLAISNVLEASKLKKLKNMDEMNKKINSLRKKYPQLEKKLEKVITISSIISNVQVDSIDLERSKSKVIVLGLDNAGKTAILTKFGGKLGIQDLVGLRPTKGVERKVIESSNLELFIWDFGGQKEYRDKYINKPELYFFQLDLLLYVIDVQDSERFEGSFEYFEKILDILINLEENPYILIFIHKYDPDLKNDPTLLLNVEFLKENLKEVFENRDFDFAYEIYLTSIYSLISNEPQFSKYIKDVMKTAHSINDPTIKRVEGLGEILEDTLNAVIRLSQSISLQLSALEHRIAAVEGGAFLAANSGESIEIQTIDKRIPSENTRSHVLSELKDLFAKKKSLDID